jgi:hypothetical protein
MLDLYNALEQEHIFSGTFVIHMKDNMLALLNEVPGSVYTKKLDCYRELYKTLNNKSERMKSKSIRKEMLEKIEYIEELFPELLI